jgi:hypothetical protein
MLSWNLASTLSRSWGSVTEVSGFGGRGAVFRSLIQDHGAR